MDREAWCCSPWGARVRQTGLGVNSNCAKRPSSLTPLKQLIIIILYFLFRKKTSSTKVKVTQVVAQAAPGVHPTGCRKLCIHPGCQTGLAGAGGRGKSTAVCSSKCRGSAGKLQSRWYGREDQEIAAFDVSPGQECKPLSPPASP